MKNQSGRVTNSFYNLCSGAAGELLSIILKFVMRTVFIYTLGKAYLGINGLLANTLTMLSLAELGMAHAINYRLYKPLSERNEQRIRVIMKFYKQAYRVIGGVTLVLGLCLMPFLRYLIKDYASLESIGIDAALIFFLFLMQSVSSYLFFAYRSAIVRADQKEYLLNLVGFAVMIVSSIFQILILVFLKNFIIFTASTIVFNILQNLINATIASRNYPFINQKTEESLSKEEIISLFKDCGALFIYRINSVVLNATDNLVISSFIGLGTVGIYSNYLLFYTTTKSLLQNLYNAVSASLGNLFATANADMRYQFFEIMNFLTAVLYGTVAVGLAVVANELIHVWIGADYLIQQPFAVLIGIQVYCLGLKTNLGQIRHVMGLFQQAKFRPLVSVFINLAVSIALVQVWGIFGVLIGTICADLATNIMVDPRMIHKYGFDNYKPVSAYYKKNGLYVGVIILICLAVWLICSHLFVGFGWLSVILHAIICGVSVPGIMLLLFHKRPECQYLIKIVGNLLKKPRRK